MGSNRKLIGNKYILKNGSFGNKRLIYNVIKVIVNHTLLIDHYELYIKINNILGTFNKSHKARKLISKIKSHDKVSYPFRKSHDEVSYPFG